VLTATTTMHKSAAATRAACGRTYSRSSRLTSATVVSSRRIAFAWDGLCCSDKGRPSGCGR
jgi:hypothetical protein